VHDVAEAFLVAAESGSSGTYNVGWGEERTVVELLDVLQKAAGTHLEPEFEPLRRGELRRSALNLHKLRALGWAPSVQFETGLHDTFVTYA